MTNSLVLIAICLFVVLLFVRYYVLSKQRIDAMRRQIKVLTDDLETKSEAEKIQSARWQAASSVLEEALLLIDSELNLLYANPIAVQIFGDISDSGVSIVSYTHSEEFESECRGVVSGETDEELYEWQSEFQDSVFQVRALRFDYGAVLALSDVSNLHHLEQARRDMFANISHELRTPLTSISLLLDMLVTREQSADTISALEKMTTETDTLKEMAQELLDISLIESGRFAIKLDSANAAALIMPTIERLQPQADLKSIQFHMTECTDVPVWADADQVQRVLSCLLYTSPSPRD